jgi:four helix bundle protein
MDSSELRNRTKQFAHRCVSLSLSLPDTYLGNHIRGQLIRCSTSVASNNRATCFAQSKASFIAKLSVVLLLVQSCRLNRNVSVQATSLNQR